MYIAMKLLTRSYGGWVIQETDLETLILRDVLTLNDEVLIEIDLDGARLQFHPSKQNLTETQLNMDVYDYVGNIVEEPIDSSSLLKTFDRLGKVFYSEIEDHGLTSVSANYEIDGNIGKGVRYNPDIKISKLLSTALDVVDREGLMFFINGQMFPVQESASTGDVYILNGMEYLNVTDVGCMGLVDFSEVGGYEMRAFGATDIKFQTSSNNESIGVIDVDYLMDHLETNKKVFLMLNGFLDLDNPITLDDITYYNHTPLFRLPVCHKRAVREIGKLSGDYVDWVDSLPHNKKFFNLESFDWAKYLTTGNSGFVILDEDVCVSEENLGRTDVDNTYTHYRMPCGMVQFEDRLMCHYYTDIFEESIVSIKCNSPRIHGVMLGDSLPIQDIKLLTNQVDKKIKQGSVARVFDIYKI